MIRYNIVPTLNPTDATKTYYRAKEVNQGDFTFDDLVQKITESTTATEADACCVLKAMKTHIHEALRNGQTVVLEDIGRFNVTLHSKCFTKDEYQADGFNINGQLKYKDPDTGAVKGPKIKFRPAASLRANVIDKAKTQLMEVPKALQKPKSTNTEGSY